LRPGEKTERTENVGGVVRNVTFHGEETEKMPALKGPGQQTLVLPGKAGWGRNTNRSELKKVK
jgi:hypothetical protein